MSILLQNWVPGELERGNETIRKEKHGGQEFLELGNEEERFLQREEGNKITTALQAL